MNVILTTITWLRWHLAGFSTAILLFLSLPLIITFWGDAFFPFLLSYYRCTLWHLQKFLHHTWIHPLHHSPLSSLPHSWNSVNRSHFSTYTHVYMVFPPFSPPAPFPYVLPPPTGTNLQIEHGLYFCSLFLEKKKETFLFV
jgi:hypothetical protein